MATATISGTITYPIASGGPDASMIIGTPSITPSSSSGPQLTFTEKSVGSYKVAVGGPVTIPFATVADCDLLYVGSDQPVTIIFNGGAESFTLPIGGFIMMYKASITGMTVEATLLDANVEVLILGE